MEASRHRCEYACKGAHVSLLSLPILRYSLFYTAAPIRLPWTRAGVIGFKLSRERVSQGRDFHQTS